MWGHAGAHVNVCGVHTMEHAGECRQVVHIRARVSVGRVHAGAQASMQVVCAGAHLSVQALLHLQAALPQALFHPHQSAG